MRNASAPIAPTAQLTVFYDRTCPLCLSEMTRLRRWDKHGRLAMIDCTAADFRAADYGFTAEALDRELHGIGYDGQVLRGLACIRRAYALTRYGWLWRVTAWPLLRLLFDRFYLWFARNRQSISRYAHSGSKPGQACSELCEDKLMGT